MAKIFVALYNFGRKKEDFNAFPPFYESFVYGLKEAGNDVLCFHQKTFTRSFDNPIPVEQARIIKNFNPELCILFCNKFWDISLIVDCPIVIYDTDSPLEYAGINNLKSNINRYMFVVSQTAGVNLLQSYLNVKKENCTIIPFFTEVRSNESAVVDRNIGFLGTNWLWRGYDFLNAYMRKNPSAEDKECTRQIIDSFTKYPFESTEQLKKRLNFSEKDCSFDFRDTRRAAIEISGLRRLHYLSAVSDLGLEIRGAYWNIECMNYFPEVSLCFNAEQTFTKQENELYYNSSLLSLNTKHIQAQNGFSFRVCDIMASNACLVSEKSEDLKNLFPSVNLPMFSSPRELRSLSKNLLNNNDLRLEIVQKSQEEIEKNHRFRHVLDKLENFCNINLHSSSSGSLIIYSDEDSVSYANVLSKFVEPAHYSAIKLFQEIPPTKVKHSNDPSDGRTTKKRGKFARSLVELVKSVRNYFFSTSIFGIKKINETKTNIYIFFIPFFTIRKTLRYKTFNFWFLDCLIHGAFSLMRQVKLLFEKSFQTTQVGDWILVTRFGFKKYFSPVSKYQELFVTLKYLNDTAGFDDPELLSLLERSNIPINKMTRSKYEKTKLSVLDYLSNFDATQIPPATGLVRDHQKKLMDLMIEIRDFFNSANMHLMLTGGNLLGSVRHNGFIPWDDDADFDMIRAEYDLALPLLKQKYKFCDTTKCRNWTDFYKTIDESLKISFGEIIFAQTYSGIKIYKGTSIKDAISLDIFPIDFISDSVSDEQFKTFWHNTKTSTLKGCKNWGEGFDLMDNIVHNSGIFSPTGKRFYYGLGNHGFWNFKYSGLRPVDVLLPFGKVSFEGDIFYCPNNIDGFLTPLYGDYMKLPHKILLSEHLQIAEKFLNK